MKKAIFQVLILLLVILMARCGGEGGTETGSTTADTVFYDAVREVAPSFAPVSPSPSLSKDLTTDWESGNPLRELFYILREFNPDTEQGVIDTSNLYKTMWEARNFFSNTKENCAAITEQAITPPFDFENDATTYNCAYNEDAEDGYDFGGAIKELDADGNIVEVTEESMASTDAAVKYGLFGFVWVDSTDGHLEHGTLQGSFKSSTNDLSLDIAVWVDYTDQNDYCYRNDIEGDTEDHTFTFRSIKGNKVEGSSYLSVVGSGYSQGEGKYFLLRINTNDLTNKYYCIGAEDDEAALKAMSAEGSDAVDPNCAEYEEVDALLIPFTTDDLACGSSDFNPGGTGMAAEGTIFLNYQ